MELNGTLDQFPLPELITMIHSSSVTGVLEVGVAPTAGYFCCRDGRIYHAVCAEATGLDALRHITELSRAPFRFIAGAVSESETIHHDALRLVEYVTLVSQLLQQARPYVSDTASVPVLRVSERAVRVDMLTWQVLAAIDGERSIDAIAALLDADALEVSAIIGGLIERRLATLLPSRLVKHADPTPHDPGEPPNSIRNSLTKRVLGPHTIAFDTLSEHHWLLSARSWWTYAHAY